MPIDQAFIDQYKELLIIQYSDKEKAVAEIAVLTGSLSKIFALIDSFDDEFDIDQAYGDRLDIIGKIVGVNRIVPEGIAKKYFGFAGTTNALTFGAGPFFDLFNDSAYTSTELNDNQYRFFIKAKAAKNITSAYMVNDDRISLQETIQVLFSNRAYFVDNKDMSLSLYVEESFPVEDLTLIQALDLIPTPQGVGIKFIASYVVDGTFGFASNPSAVTFGAGKFSKLII